MQTVLLCADLGEGNHLHVTSPPQASIRQNSPDCVYANLGCCPWSAPIHNGGWPDVLPHLSFLSLVLTALIVFCSLTRMLYVLALLPPLFHGKKWYLSLLHHCGYLCCSPWDILREEEDVSQLCLSVLLAL